MIISSIYQFTHIFSDNFKVKNKKLFPSYVKKLIRLENKKEKFFIDFILNDKKKLFTEIIYEDGKTETIPPESENVFYMTCCYNSCDIYCVKHIDSLDCELDVATFDSTNKRVLFTSFYRPNIIKSKIYDNGFFLQYKEQEQIVYRFYVNRRLENDKIQTYYDGVFKSLDFKDGQFFNKFGTLIFQESLSNNKTPFLEIMIDCTPHKFNKFFL